MLPPPPFADFRNKIGTKRTNLVSFGYVWFQGQSGHALEASRPANSVGGPILGEVPRLFNCLSLGI